MASGVHHLFLTGKAPSYGKQPLQPFTGDSAGRGYGRSDRACGVEPAPGTGVPAARRRRLVARGGGGLQAERVLPEYARPACRRPGQRPAHGVGSGHTDTPITHLSDLERALYRTGVYGQADYSITRDGIALDTPVKVIPVPLDRSLLQAQRLIGLVYLAIGIYVLFRRWTAPRAMHFYLFCLVSFALYTLKYTGELDALDWTVFWINVVAESPAAGALPPLRPQLP